MHGIKPYPNDPWLSLGILFEQWGRHLKLVIADDELPGFNIDSNQPSVIGHNVDLRFDNVFEKFVATTCKFVERIFSSSCNHAVLHHETASLIATTQ